MAEQIVALRDAKAHLSALTDRVAGGDEVVIAKRGRLVARLTSVTKARKPVNLARLRTLTQQMPRQPEAAGEFLQRMRDQNRY